MARASAGTSDAEGSVQGRAAKLIVTGDSASIPASFVEIGIEFGAADTFFRLERTVDSKAPIANAVVFVPSSGVENRPTK